MRGRDSRNDSYTALPSSSCLGSMFMSACSMCITHSCFLIFHSNERQSKQKKYFIVFGIIIMYVYCPWSLAEISEDTDLRICIENVGQEDGMIWISSVFCGAHFFFSYKLNFILVSPLLHSTELQICVCYLSGSVLGMCRSFCPYPSKCNESFVLQ